MAGGTTTVVWPVGSAGASARARASAAADSWRAAGSFAMARSTSTASTSGTPWARRSGTGSEAMRPISARMLSSVSFTKAAWPASSSNSVEPSEYTSERAVGDSPLTTSGGAWARLAVTT